jgi:hypothetical protein
MTSIIKTIVTTHAFSIIVKVINIIMTKIITKMSSNK